jgi:ferredoxin-type protein NapH
MQAWLADQQFKSQAFLGALIVAAFYLAVGGRAFCAWVCPVNIVTDFAHWLRTRLGLRGNTRIHRNTRYWLLAAVLMLAAITGLVTWEWVNPVSVLHRGLLFGMGAGWLLIIAVFLFDLAVSRRGWCGHICPVGAFYSLLGARSLIRISAHNRDDCNKCMDCYAVCPEPQVIKPALFGQEDGIGPLIDEANCTNCGRCIDVCTRDVFSFGSRYGGRKSTGRARPGIHQSINYPSEEFEKKEART